MFARQVVISLGGWIYLTLAEDRPNWRAGLEESIHGACVGREDISTEDQGQKGWEVSTEVRRKPEVCSTQKPGKKFSRDSEHWGQIKSRASVREEVRGVLDGPMSRGPGGLGGGRLCG